MFKKTNLQNFINQVISFEKSEALTKTYKKNKLNNRTINNNKQKNIEKNNSKRSRNEREKNNRKKIEIENEIVTIVKKNITIIKKIEKVIIILITNQFKKKLEINSIVN